MALQTSGQISIGDIRTELGDTGAQGLGDADARDLAGVASGAIGLNDFYGASAGAFTETHTNISARIQTDSSTTSPSTLVLPSDAAAGDFCAITWSTRSTSAVRSAPSGWTRNYGAYQFTSGKSTIYLRTYIFYRILADTTSIATQFSGVSGTNGEGCHLLLFKPADTSKTFTNVSAGNWLARNSVSTTSYTWSFTNTATQHVSIVTGGSDGTGVLSVPTASSSYTQTGSAPQYSAISDRNAVLVKTNDTYTSGSTEIPWSVGTTDQVCQLGGSFYLTLSN